MTAKKDLEIQQGATFYLAFDLDKIDANGDQVPVDLTGATARMQIRPSAKSNTIYLDIGEGGFITIPEPLDGLVELDIPASETSQLDFSTAVYDIEIEFPDGDVIRLLEGRVILSYEVTR